MYNGSLEAVFIPLTKNLTPPLTNPLLIELRSLLSEKYSYHTLPIQCRPLSGKIWKNLG